MKKNMKALKYTLVVMAMMSYGMISAQQAADPMAPADKTQPAKQTVTTQQADPNAPPSQVAPARTVVTEDKNLHTTPATPSAAHSTPAKASPHPVSKAAGAEATRAKPVPAHQAHSGPTPVNKPTGAEATHRKPVPVHGHRSGPVPVHSSTTEHKGDRSTK